ncbi:MAG: hypothetical protein RL148_761 [Planctomycetota bacterium]
MNGPVVLIADNDRAVGGLLRELLSRSGAEVHMVEDGEAAKARLAQGGIDVLVCDLDMPRASGQEVAAWLATQPQQPAMLVVSGYVDEATRAQLGAMPFVRAVLSKPFDLFAFRDAVMAVPRSAAAVPPPVHEPEPQPAAPASAAVPSDVPAGAPAVAAVESAAVLVPLPPQPPLPPPPTADAGLPAAAADARVPAPTLPFLLEACALPGVPRPVAAPEAAELPSQPARSQP